MFPLEGKHGLDRLPTIDYRSCNQGYKVRFLLLSVLLRMRPAEQVGRVPALVPPFQALCHTIHFAACHIKQGSKKLSFRAAQLGVMQPV